MEKLKSNWFWMGLLTVSIGIISTYIYKKKKSIRIVGLYVYPIKSCKGIELQEAEMFQAGIKHDRQFMLVNKNNKFISQREFPKMGAIMTRLEGSYLYVTIPGEEEMKIALDVAENFEKNPEIVNVSVWNDLCDAIVLKECSVKFSEFFGQPVSLVQMAPNFKRLVDRKRSILQSDHVNFADGFPALVTSMASLRKLNSILNIKGDPTVTMEVFRPNIVLDSFSMIDWEEELWAQFMVNDIIFHNVKPCTRCAVPSIDLVTRKLKKNLEPVASLIKMHNDNEGNGLFGINVIPEFVNKEFCFLRINDKVMNIILK